MQKMFRYLSVMWAIHYIHKWLNVESVGLQQDGTANGKHNHANEVPNTKIQSNPMRKTAKNGTCKICLVVISRAADKHWIRRKKRKRIHRSRRTNEQQICNESNSKYPISTRRRLCGGLGHVQWSVRATEMWITPNNGICLAILSTFGFEFRTLDASFAKGYCVPNVFYGFAAWIVVPAEMRWLQIHRKVKVVYLFR